MKAARWVLMGMVLAVFGRVLTHPFIAFDDTEHILRNPLVTNPSVGIDQLLTPSVGYIVPVTINFEALLFAVSGGAPWSFHAAGLALHLLCVWLVVVLARRLGASELAAVSAAALFALHPVVVEPVAWATGVKDGLAAALALGATALWLRRDRVALLAPALAVLAVLAKPNVALLAVPWLIYAHFGQATASGPDRRVAWVALALTGLVAVPSALSNYLFVEHTEAAWQWSKPLSVLAVQLEHLIVPLDLAPKYPEAAGWAPVAAGTAILLATALLCWRWRPRAAVAFALALACAFYLPSSQIIPFPRGAADSYLYLPLAAGAVAAAVALPQRRWIPAAAAGLAVVLAMGTTLQLGRWAQPTQLWAPRIAANPGWLDGRVKLADQLVFEGRHEEAVGQLREVFARGRVPSALRSFGIALGRAGYLDDAECVLIDAVHHDPDDEEALFNYGITMTVAPDRPAAHPAMQTALLARLDSKIETGELTWSPELRPALDARRAEAGGEATGWDVGQCRALQRRLQ